ncbi:MAG: hypothetical protein M3419_02660 [Actinomycetota bacterium]|nr:hypothetical protein [Actinomycetota bacterium]
MRVHLCGVLGLGGWFGAWFVGQRVSHPLDHHQLGRRRVGVPARQRLDQPCGRRGDPLGVVVAADHQHEGRLPSVGDLVGADPEQTSTSLDSALRWLLAGIATSTSG